MIFRTPVRDFPPVNGTSFRRATNNAGLCTLYFDPVGGAMDANQLEAPVAAFGAADGVDHAQGPYLDLWAVMATTACARLEIAEANHWGGAAGVPGWRVVREALCFFEEPTRVIHKIGGTVLRVRAILFAPLVGTTGEIEIAALIRPHP